MIFKFFSAGRGTQDLVLPRHCGPHPGCVVLGTFNYVRERGLKWLNNLPIYEYLIYLTSTTQLGILAIFRVFFFFPENLFFHIQLPMCCAR